MTLRSTSRPVRAVAPAACSVAIALVVAGCGGGGGGGGAGVAAAPAPAVGVSGKYSKSTLVYVPFSATSVAQTQSRGTQDVTITTNSTGGTVSVAGSGSSGTMQRGIGTSTSPVQSFSGPNGEMLVSRVASADVLTNASYGVYGFVDGNGSYIGGFHDGTVTPMSQMPGSSVRASYSGTFAGYEISDSRILDAVTGTTILDANFGSGAISGRVYGMERSSGISAGYGLSMNGTITGNTYSGTAGFTNATGTAAAGSVTSSAMSGAFYGSNAAETAGAVTVSGSAPTLGAGTVTGGFGAVRR